MTGTSVALGLVPLDEVLARTTLSHRELEELRRDDKFPEPTTYQGQPYWYVSDIDEWIDDLPVAQDLDPTMFGLDAPEENTSAPKWQRQAWRRPKTALQPPRLEPPSEPIMLLKEMPTKKPGKTR